MSSAKRQAGVTLTAIAIVVSMVAAVSILAVAPAAANDHTYEDAPNLDDRGNFTVNLPFPTDHYPGDMNEENGSIEYFASGDKAFNDLGAEDGLWMNTIVVQADWIDYTACSTENTGAFGLDRGNNNTGTQSDESLLEHRRDDNFRPDGLDVYFYTWDDFAGDPPYMAPEDAIVAAQGKEEGPCLTVTSEPGWYQIQGFLNGTIADGDCTEEGNSDCQPENEEEVGVRLKSNYLYVCECDSEQEARDDLGPPPNEDGGEETPTPTDTPTPTEADPGDDPTPTPTDSDTPPQTPTTEDNATPTQTPEDGATPTPTEGGSEPNDGGGGGPEAGGDGGGNNTPTVGGGPGFTPGLAVLALLGAALLVMRRP